MVDFVPVRVDQRSSSLLVYVPRSLGAAIGLVSDCVRSCSAKFDWRGDVSELVGSTVACDPLPSPELVGFCGGRAVRVLEIRGVRTAVDAVSVRRVAGLRSVGPVNNTWLTLSLPRSMFSADPDDCRTRLFPWDFVS